jgi:glycosyltransferase involved in cell wall biosynthesis
MEVRKCTLENLGIGSENLSMDLSICIPVYNNKDLFPYCLDAIGKAVRGIESRVEVVISDNASEHDIPGCVALFQKKYPNVITKYSRNETNRGPAYNVHKVVAISEGMFSWIIGSDDFVMKDGVMSILNIIDDNPDIDFISVNYSHLFLEKIYDSTNISDPYHCIPNAIDDINMLYTRKIKKVTERVDRWDTLIDPAYNNVMMGAAMAGVFRRKRWMSVSVDIEKMVINNLFTNVENTYPHCFVYSKSMIGRPAYYLNKPVIVVGEGARDWMGKQVWDGYLPIIYLNIFDEIVDSYKAGGLELEQAKKCRGHISKLVGQHIIPYIFRRYFLRQHIKNQQFIHLLNIVRRNWRNTQFYSGIKYYLTKRRKKRK